MITTMDRRVTDRTATSSLAGTDTPAAPAGQAMAALDDTMGGRDIHNWITGAA